jgi:Flp pilus assembly protein TadG
MMAPLFIFALIAFYGMAIDSARLFQMRNRIQRAVDAGAVAGSRLIGTTDANKALALAQALTEDNLHQMGYQVGTDPGQISVNVKWNDLPIGTTQLGSEIMVSASVNMKNTFLSTIKGFSESTQLATSAVAATKVSVVCLVVDMSGSMGRSMSQWGPLKIDEAKEAVNSFLDIFKEGEDWIGIVAFNTEAQVVGEISPYFLKYKPNVNSLSPVQNTNIDAGIRECYNQLRKVDSSVAVSSNRAIILITDGAPTKSCVPYGSGTTHLSDIKGNPINCELDGSGGGDTDEKRHYDRAIKTADYIRQQMEGITIHTIGIGALPVDGAIELLGSDKFKKCDSLDTQCTFTCPVDLSLYVGGNQKCIEQRRINKELIDITNVVYGPPGLNNINFVLDSPTSLAMAKDIMTQVELTDAYQMIRDSDNTMKSTFLRRVALSAPPNNHEPVNYFDCSSDAYIRGHLTKPTNHPTNDCGPVPTYQQYISANPKSAEGRFIPTNDPTRLKDILIDLGIRMRARLVH